jgi:hypothetical protein
MNTRNKMTSGLRPHASGCTSLQGSKRLTACGLQLVALLLFMAITENTYAQASFPPVTINLNFPQYQRLKLDGGYEYISDVGIQGIILYRESENKYIAYERTCSVNDDAPVTVDGSGLFMKGCNSTFSFSDGYPTSGTVRQPLLKYRTSLNGQSLTITDEVVF